MRKFARVAGVILLLFVVGCTSLDQPRNSAQPSLVLSSVLTPNLQILGMHRVSDGNILHGNPPGNPGKNLLHGRPRENIYTPETVRDIGGVIFQGTAVPAGSAAGKLVAITYNPKQADGQRLRLTIGGKAVTAELYDWEMIPIARFVNSGYTSCLTLYDKARTDEEERLDNIHDDIMWVNFHPALANTLVGLNLLFADAMFVNIDLMQFADEVFDTRIPGYHIPRQNDQSTDEIDALIFLGALLLDVESYFYTDYGREISYSIADNRIEFKGTPFYSFVGLDPSDNVIVGDELNELFDEMHDNIFDINPTVYRTAERTAQWVAFFRMVQEDYPQVWQRFMGQIDGITVPVVETPRYWLSGTERE